MKKKGILSVFKSKKPIIAMIHLKGDTPEDIFERAKKEITIFEENGVRKFAEVVFPECRGTR